MIEQAKKKTAEDLGFQSWDDIFRLGNDVKMKMAADKALSHLAILLLKNITEKKHSFCRRREACRKAIKYGRNYRQF